MMRLSETTGLTVLNYDDYPVAPWKNGQGVTREIFKYAPEPIFDWRLSLADVSQSGEFSSFTGYERIITLLDGDGFSLDFGDGQKKDLGGLHEPFVFDGGAPLDCRLFGGPSKDLNLMIRREHIKADWQIHDIQSSLDVDLEGDHVHLIFCLQGNFYVKREDAAPYEIREWGCVRHYDASRAVVSIRSGGPGKVFHIKIAGVQQT